MQETALQDGRNRSLSLEAVFPLSQNIGPPRITLPGNPSTGSCGDKDLSQRAFNWRGQEANRGPPSTHKAGIQPLSSPVASYLHAGLNLRELVHDGQDGFHGAPSLQIGLVSYKDDRDPRTDTVAFICLNHSS